MRRFALLLPATLIMAACGAPSTSAEDPASLLIGEWEQVSPVTLTQNGSTLTFMDGEMQFAADGTTESDTRLSFEGQPAEIASYAMESDGTWTLSSDRLTVGITALSVTPIDDNPQSRQMA
ncbi:MAG: lipocalin family protein [Litorimonas sp.]